MWWLIFVIIMLILIIIYLSFNLVSYKVNTRESTKKLEYILTNETNAELSMLVNNKDFQLLLTHMNRFIREMKNNRIQMNELNQNLKTTFSNVTHDLRTPLTVVHGYLQLLESGNVTEEDMPEILDKMQYNITRLSSQLDALFEYSKLQEQQETIQYEMIQLSELVAQTTFSYFESFQKAGVEMNLQIDDDVKLISDKAMLLRILQNLLGNILVHGAEQAEVSLMKKNDEIILVVKNTHNSKHLELEHVFDRFYTNDFARTNKNTGLGLYIVKSFTEALHGTVQATLEDNWFVVCVTLPLK